MDYSLKSGDITQLKTACLIVGVYVGGKLTATAELVNQASQGQLARVLKKGDLSGKPGSTLMLYDIPGNRAERILAVGLGSEKSTTLSDFSKAIAKAVTVVDKSHSIEALCTLTASPVEGISPYTMVRASVIQAEESLYQFNQCKSEAKHPKRPLKKLGLYTGASRRNISTLAKAAKHGYAIATGIRTAKDLSNLPGNLCTPEFLASEARALSRRSKKLTVKVLSEKQMEKLGMGALLSVSRGSRQPAKLIVMEYQGGKPNSKPIALVGKGLTFDAGGISLKPAAGMDEMKYDMCGGASVIGTMAACIGMELPVNVVCVIPTSENLPDGEANKPGDIVTSMSGQTIEILNTDAEGRLILCDALTYVERFKPTAVVDIATLTGACVVALGNQASGLLANDDKLASELLAAGESCSDRAWRLPLWEEYQKQLDSNFADMANIGGKGGGTITAACFLSRFAKKFKWAHLDIAGTAWKSGAAKGATGRPVALLTQFLLTKSGFKA